MADSTSHGTNYLKYIKFTDTEEYIPAISGGKVIKVLSDHTISIATTLDTDESVPPNIYRFSIWLFDKSDFENDRNVSEIMRNVLSARILGKIVSLKNISIDKGRIMADVFCEDEHVNEWILEQRHCKF